MKSHIFLSLSVILGAYASFSSGEKIAIIHWNDVNGQIESFVEGTSNSMAEPEPCPNGDTSCIGGIINLVHHIHEPVGAGVSQTIRLSSGNLIGEESGWIPSIADGWLKFGTFVREHIRPDVMTLGMKEFGAGVSKTTQFMNAINWESNTNWSSIYEKKDVILANTCQDGKGSIDNETIRFCSKLAQIKTISVGSAEIGIIGFIAPTVMQLSLPGKLAFVNVTTRIQQIITAHPHINTFIAIGDGDLNLAKEIIDECPKVKLVIYSSGFSNPQNITDVYPLPYQNSFIATAGRFGSSIGKLILDWEVATGDIKVDPWSTLVTTRRADPLNDHASNATSSYSDFEITVRGARNDLIGHTRIPLEGGSKCWSRECNLGNLVTDAMVHCAVMKAPAAKPFLYPIDSIWHAGALFPETFSSGARVSKLDIKKWLPYHNGAHLVKITGSSLRRVFQESATGIHPELENKNNWGQFLQVSKGIQVKYNADSGIPKLAQLRMTHFDGNGTEVIAPIQDGRDYWLVIPTHLYEGRGVYGFTKGRWTDIIHDNVSYANIALDYDCVESYVRATREISVGYEGRIEVDDDPSVYSLAAEHRGIAPILGIISMIALLLANY